MKGDSQTPKKNSSSVYPIKFIHMRYEKRFIHFILQVTKKGEQDNVGESLEHYEIKETKAENENTRKNQVCNICGIFFMNEFIFVSNNHNHWTICNIQFNDLKPLIHKRN